MKDLLDLLNGLQPIVKVYLVVGTILIAGGMGIQAFDIMIPEHSHKVAMSIGFALYFLAFIANEMKKSRDFKFEEMKREGEAQRRTDDMTMRKAKLDAGGDPADDKTIFRIPDDPKQ